MDKQLICEINGIKPLDSKIVNDELLPSPELGRFVVGCPYPTPDL